MMNAFLERAKAKAGLNKLKPAKDKIKKVKKNKKASEPERFVPGSIFIGHLPHGFYEDQLHAYFSQFGKILRLRVARSRKTGGCKGYAFIEFESEDVAKIAAEAMDNYMFFEKLLKCKFIPHEELHEKTFIGWKLGMPLGSEKNRIRQNASRSEKVLLKRKRDRIARLSNLKTTLKDQGIDFKFEAIE